MPKLFVNYTCTGCQQALARIGRDRQGNIVDPENRFGPHVEIVPLGSPQFDFYSIMTVPTLIMDPPEFIPRSDSNHEAAKANARRTSRVSGGMGILGALQQRYPSPSAGPSASSGYRQMGTRR